MQPESKNDGYRCQDGVRVFTAFVNSLEQFMKKYFKSFAIQSQNWHYIDVKCDSKIVVIGVWMIHRLCVIQHFQ